MYVHDKLSSLYHNTLHQYTTEKHPKELKIYVHKHIHILHILNVHLYHLSISWSGNGGETCRYRKRQKKKINIRDTQPIWQDAIKKRQMQASTFISGTLFDLISPAPNTLPRT